MFLAKLNHMPGAKNESRRYLGGYTTEPMMGSPFESSMTVPENVISPERAT